MEAFAVLSIVELDDDSPLKNKLFKLSISFKRMVDTVICNYELKVGMTCDGCSGAVTRILSKAGKLNCLTVKASLTSSVTLKPKR